jgi:NitT/TauT family transport system ATP-binding protein
VTGDRTSADRRVPTSEFILAMSAIIGIRRVGRNSEGPECGMDVVVDNVSQVFVGRHGTSVVALDRFSHRFRSHRFTCLLGPSGCGKSTLIQIVGGLEQATSGTVRIVDPDRPDASRRLGADSVMMWQSLNLFPWRNVIDNVAFGLEVRGVARAVRYQKARALVASVGLRGFESHLPGQLSGGMRQRVALARALIMERAILLMDEPFAALDAQTKIVMQEELLRIFDVTHKTVLFVTHSIEEAILLGDEVLVMTARPGRIKEIIAVDLPRPRSVEMVNSQQFGTLFDRVFHLIRDEVMKTMEQQAAAVGA